MKLGRFERATLAWWAGLTVLAALFALTGGRPDDRPFTLIGFIRSIVNPATLVLPAAVFGGGIALCRAGWRAVAGRGLLLAMLTWVLIAYVGVYTDHRWDLALELATTADAPKTPGRILEERAATLADPPATYGYWMLPGVGRPPNGLLYDVIAPIAIALAAVLMALLGRAAGRLTINMRAPPRRNARWALGLMCVLLFGISTDGWGKWLRLSPYLSAWVAAVMPLVVLAGVLLVLHLLLVRRDRLHASGSGSV